MKNELYVDFDVFDERIADFEKAAENFELIFNKIINLLNTMTKNEWQGSSSEAFEKKTAELIGSMDINKEIIRDFISDLKQIKAEFSDTEDKAAMLASALNDIH